MEELRRQLSKLKLAETRARKSRRDESVLPAPGTEVVTALGVPHGHLDDHGLETRGLEHPGRYYVGCFKDAFDRDLPNLEKLFFVTPKTCMTRCASTANKFAGLQAGGECWCGKTVGKHGATSDCLQRCDADSSFTCGSGFVNDVYFARKWDSP